MNGEQADLFDRLKAAADAVDLLDQDAVAAALGVVFVPRLLDQPGRREFEAPGAGAVRRVDLLQFPGAGDGHTATLSLKLDRNAFGTQELKWRLGPWLETLTMHGADMSGFPHPVLRSETWRAGRHLFFVQTRIGAPIERPDAVGLMQTAARAPAAPPGNLFM